MTPNVIRLLIVSICLLFGLVLTHCADPLDITNQPVPPDQNPNDTLFTVDTVFLIDTVTQNHFDTTYVIDTVFHSDIDTVLIIDTITQNHFDTTYVVDTVHHSDVDTVTIVDTVTVIHPDTVSIIDTVYHTDTLTIVDTVFVTNDTARLICGRIEACQKEIVWLLQNEPGQYRLSFAACIEKDQPPQSLTVEIDGGGYSWNTASSVNLIIDRWLDSDATITITSQKPPARGHAVYVCLSITRY